MGDSSQSNAGSDGAGAEGGAPKYAADKELNDHINKAIGNRLDAFAKSSEKKTKELLESSFKAFLPELDQVLSSKLEGLTSRSGEGEKKGSADPAHAKIEDHPQFRGLLKQVDDLKKRTETSEAQANAERSKARDVSMRQRLAEELGKHGIDPKRARHAIGLLVDSEKRVRFSDDDDAIIFRDNDGTDVDLESGLKGWAASEDAKIYLPPRGAAGSGDRGGGRRPATAGQKQETSYEDVGNAVLASFPTMTTGR